MFRVLGPDDGEITFNGIFSGPDAEARVRALDELRLSGAVVWLNWQSFKRRIIVRSFIAQYHSQWWIPYQISCVVIQQVETRTNQFLSREVGLLADLEAAVLATAGSPVEVSGLQSAFSRQAALVGGTSDHLWATEEIARSKSEIELQIDVQSALLISQSQLEVSNKHCDQAFSIIVGSAGLLASAVIAKAYIGRIGVKLHGLIS